MIGYAKHLRDLLVCKDPETVQLMEVGAGIRERYLSQSAHVPVPFLFEGLEISNQADMQFRTSRNQRLTIELALVKLAGLVPGQKKKASDTEQVTASDRDEFDPGSKTPQLRETSSPEKQELDAQSSDNKEIPIRKGGEMATGKAAENGSSVVRKSSISIKNTLQGTGRMDSKKTEVPQSAEADINQPATDGTAPDPDLILNAWKSYASSVEKSRPRIYSTLTTNKPVVRADGTVQLMLNSESQLENFVKRIKPELIAYIRKETGLDQLNIETGLLASQSNGTRIYTEQDKLDYLLKKNPDLGKLKTRFNLDFDD